MRSTRTLVLLHQHHWPISCCQAPCIWCHRKRPAWLPQPQTKRQKCGQGFQSCALGEGVSHFPSTGAACGRARKRGKARGSNPRVRIFCCMFTNASSKAYTGSQTQAAVRATSSPHTKRSVCSSSRKAASRADSGGLKPTCGSTCPSKAGDRMLDEGCWNPNAGLPGCSHSTGSTAAPVADKLTYAVLGCMRLTCRLTLVAQRDVHVARAQTRARRASAMTRARLRARARKLLQARDDLAVAHAAAAAPHARALHQPARGRRSAPCSAWS